MNLKVGQKVTVNLNTVNDGDRDYFNQHAYSHGFGIVLKIGNSICLIGGPDSHFPMLTGDIIAYNQPCCLTEEMS